MNQMVDLLDDNYKLKVKLREAENKVKCLEDFIEKHDSTYNFKEMKDIFAKLTSIFQKNIETSVYTQRGPLKSKKHTPKNLSKAITTKQLQLDKVKQQFKSNQSSCYKTPRKSPLSQL